MNLKSFLILLVFTSLVLSSTGKFEFNKDDSKLNFELGNISIENKNGFTTFESNGFGSISVDGVPDLPIFSTLYQIPLGKTVEVNYEILESEIIENVDLESYKLKSDVSNKERYHSTSNFPLENLLISEINVMRDIQFIKISFIPFDYNSSSSTLEVFKHVDINIVEIDNPNYTQSDYKKPSKVFEKLYSNLISNYSPRDESEYQNSAVLYICGGNIENNSDFQELVEWRKQRGFTVYTESVSSIGSSTNSIKSYIQNAYNNFDPAPEYVALVGDVGGSYNIPTYQGNSYGFGHNDYGNACEGDHPFSQLDGNDLYPEVLIGRMSVRTTSEIENVVNKILLYEKAIYMEFTPDYYETASLVGDPSTSGNSCAITNEYIGELLTNHGVEDVRVKTSGSSYDSWMRNNLEDGVLFFNYRGYLGVSGFGNSDVDNANNGIMLPFATILTCGTNSFAEDNSSLTEHFFKAGTVANPRGAVAAVGTATYNTHTLFNNIVNMGMYDGLFSKKLSTAGAVLANGKLALDMTYPGDPDNWISAFTHWNNLIGDPSTHLWTTTPSLMNASYFSSLAVGTNYLDVNVQNIDGSPVSSAKITLYKEDEVFINSFTDENGFVNIPLTYLGAGDISLVVTKQGYKPIISNLTIENPNGGVANLDPDSSIIINDSNGNNNQEINPGELINLSIPIKNYGNSVLNNIDILLSSSSELVTIINDNQIVNSLNAGNSTDVSGFSFQLDLGAKHNENLGLKLIINSGDHSWESQINLMVNGFDFEIVNIVSGDGSAINPGEIQGFNINLLNKGVIQSDEVTGTVSTNYSEVTITNDEVNWTTLAPNSSNVSTSLFVIDISSSVVNGTLVNFELELLAESGFLRVIPFSIQIGRTTDNDPSGPDEYGYYIYDSNDLNYDLAPSYDWVEINPELGGNGQSLNLNHNGNGEWSGNGPTTQVELPFEFRFYGIDYDIITICTNGWISFGESNSEAFRNYSIPGAGGPPSMVAVFWDDLKTSQGNVYTYTDPNNNYFVVEWSNMRTYDQNSDEDFQIILYNNPVMPNGDGEIKLQYKTFNNTSVGDFNAYPPRHGGYATIGIENHFTDVGLEYTFNNNYLEGASQLENGSALFITTRSPIPLPVPEISYSYDNMDFELNIDNLDNSSLTVSNIGEEGSVMTYSLTKSGVNPFEVIGGSDIFGHVWSDSDLDEEIDYNWIDIDGVGNLLTFPHNDESANPIDIGFGFNFYGVTYSELIVNPNGWIGFGEDNTTWSNTNLPSNSAPKPAIFGFWDDLNPVATDPTGCPEGSGFVYYQNFEDKLVVWFNNVIRCTSSPEFSGVFDFQFVLHQNGDIDLNYREMDGNVGSATIGFQNADGTLAMLVAYDNDYMQSQRTLSFKKLDTVDWLYFEGEISGELMYNETSIIDIIIDASELNLGNYQAEILLSSSVQPTINIPVNLMVTDYVLLGDVNFDEQVNVTDIVLIISFILGQLTPDFNQEFAADLSGDGVVNVVDIVQVIDLILE